MRFRCSHWTILIFQQVRCFNNIVSQRKSHSIRVSCLRRFLPFWTSSNYMFDSVWILLLLFSIAKSFFPSRILICNGPDMHVQHWCSIVAFSWVIECLAAQNGAKVSNQKMQTAFEILEKSRKVHQHQPCEEHLASAQYVRQCSVLGANTINYCYVGLSSVLTFGSSMRCLFDLFLGLPKADGPFSLLRKSPNRSWKDINGYNWYNII